MSQLNVRSYTKHDTCRYIPRAGKWLRKPIIKTHKYASQTEICLFGQRSSFSSGAPDLTCLASKRNQIH